jgi:hypothetical protein
MRPLFISLLVTAASVQAGTIQFNRDIRPILSDNCFQCHGPGEKDRKGGLRLDLLDAATKPAESGAVAIVPGNSKQSELIARIFTGHADDLMPPEKSQKKLTSAQKDLLRRWIDEGAEYQGHWAFIPPVRPEVPGIKSQASSSKTGEVPETTSNPIDAFIAAELKEKKLIPAPEAAPETLLRRLALDLTGLPPTLVELDRFLSEPEIRNPKSGIPNSVWTRWVDHYLASPHYGERMAMQWLDFARYADSHGFQTDSSRSMWPWRDWVIRAFNDNKRFNDFTIEQLAGDLIPNATQDQILATGFNRNHRINGEGGIIEEEWRIENIIDRVETTGSTWLALTLNCCRCHDHKYDPISQREFYELFAFFDSIDERGTITGASNRSGGNEDPFIRVALPEQKAELAKLQDAVKSAEESMKAAEKDLPALVAAWEPKGLEQLQNTLAMWLPLDSPKVVSSGGATFTPQEDGTWLVGGKNAAKDTYTITTTLSQASSVSALLLDCLPDDQLPNKSLGRAFNGNFLLSRVEAEIKTPGAAKPQALTFARAEASYSQKGYDIKNVIGKDAFKGWAVDGPTNRNAKKAMFVLDAPAHAPAGSTLTIRLVHNGINQHNIGRFKLSYSTLGTQLVKLDGTAAVADIAAILKTPAEKRDAKQKAGLVKFFRSSVPNPVKQADDRLAAAKRAVDAFEGRLPTSMVMREKGAPVDAFILKRGEYDKPGEKVSASVPVVLGKLPAGEKADRLALAKWIASSQNPLTARVWVNRAWESFFGTGLVKTSENFGSQAEWPSHPELLDWLATEFMRTGWDMKVMMRLIATSKAYRQSAILDSRFQVSDLENRLLARGPRFRLSGEVLRDQALAISGLLVPTIGGDSVRPYMPEGVWDETSKYGNLRGYKHETGPGLHRRTMYTIWKRTAAPPTMLLFDAATREVCTVKRSRTNTPLQALSLLNEVTFVEAARAFAARMILEGGKTPEERLTWAFRTATARAPQPDELRVLASGLSKRLSTFQQQPEAAAQLIEFGEHPAPADIHAAELAAYTVTANVILNLDEVVMH